MDLNSAIFNFVFSLSGRHFLVDDAAIFLAKFLPYILVLGAFILIFLESPSKRFFFFSEAALAIILSRGIITDLIRFFYEAPRPFKALGFVPLIEVNSSSFPSGHASFLFALSAIIFSFNRNWGWFYLAASLVNGLARIFVGVHWPVDIAGGAIIGIFCAYFVWFIFGRKLEAPANKKKMPL